MKKFLLMITMFFLITSKVQAVNVVNSVPSSDVSNVITTNEFNNIIYELYNDSIDISTYTNLSTLNLDSTSHFKGIFQVKRRSDGKIFPAVGTFSGTNAKFYCDINGRYTTKYYFEMQYCYVINTENNSVDRITAGFGDLVDTSTVYTYLDDDLNYLMYQLASNYGITDSQFLSQDYQSILFFNFFDWFNGKFYKNNVTISNGGPSNSNTSTQINIQEHFKRNYFEYSEGEYVSGDLTLYDDYLEVKGLETSYPNLNLYLLRFPVVYNSYDNYQISGPIELQSISSINISTNSQTWAIGNPFPIDSGDNDYIYAFGIKNTSETSFGILSEYFSEKGELQADIINSIPFRNKYYIQIFDRFFIVDDNSTQRPSGDIANGVIDGNENYWGNQDNFTGDEQQELIENEMNGFIGTMSGDIAESEIFGILQSYEDKLFGSFIGEEDFKIEWSDVSYMGDIIIPAGSINFSEICRENEALGKVKSTINIILTFIILMNIVIYMYNLLLATLGIDNPYLFEKPIGSVTVAEYTDEKGNSYVTTTQHDGRGNSIGRRYQKSTGTNSSNSRKIGFDVPPYKRWWR